MLIYIILLYSTLSHYGAVVNTVVGALKLQLVRVRSSGLAEGILLFLKFIFILQLYISLNHQNQWEKDIYQAQRLFCNILSQLAFEK